MKVLVLGSGGREHALCWKLAQSSLLTELFVAPGNAGTASLATQVALNPDDFRAVRRCVLDHGIQMVVVGPEGPLVAGIADYFAADPQLAAVPVIGPDRSCARLEGSKAFAKAFMDRHRIPTARHASFVRGQEKDAFAFLAGLQPPYVIKADGLASGKGVVICPTAEEAKATLRDMLEEGRFGEAGETVVIEEYLKGIECSVFVLTDGDSYRILPEAKDYKRVGEGDTGPNTGGMGAVSPVPFCTPEFMDRVETQVILPTIRGLQAEGMRYRGFLFFGLMKVGGDPYVIEYNCRMGDPETEVVIPRIKSDLLHLFEGVATGTLSECDVQTDERCAATVMMVSEGYPGEYEKGKRITGLGDVDERSLVFHAGTRLLPSGQVVTHGGRVLAVTSLAPDLTDALLSSYSNIQRIQYAGRQFRKDIGKDLEALYRRK